LVKLPLAYVLGAVALIVAAIVVVPLFRGNASKPAGPSGFAGEAAPVFALQDERGRPVSLSEYRGRVVIMNLWASWCPPCRAEMPDLQRLWSAYRSRGLSVVGVDEGESPARAAAFADSLRIRFPIWIDERQQYGRVYTALGLPTTVVVGRDGVVVAGYDGALTFGQMQSAIAGLVASH
jgi:cytochrome c biogenesis protein CcmG, thiol:disulfide interchange protein DsbE